MLGELSDLKEVSLAEIAELAGELRVHFDAQCGGRHAVSMLFVTESGKPGAFVARTAPSRSKTAKYLPGVSETHELDLGRTSCSGWSRPSRSSFSGAGRRASRR